VVAEASASTLVDRGREVEAGPEAAGRLRLVPIETSAAAVRGTRAWTRTPVAPALLPAWTLAWVPEPLQLPSSPDRTRPSAQTRTSAEVGRPSLAEASADTSWALAAPALRASRPPPSAATPSARLIHKFTWSAPW
jgi:hypothetical protein